MRKRAAALVVDKVEVFLKRKGRHVKVMTVVTDRRRILESCQSDLASGHNCIGKRRATWSVELQSTQNEKTLYGVLGITVSVCLPHHAERRRANKVNLVSPVHIYCSCCMPEQAGNTMIQCSTCKEWFDIEAVPPEAFDSGTKWFCNNCT